MTEKVNCKGVLLHDVSAFRISCLFGSADTVEYEHYSETISLLYEENGYERKKTQEEGIFVLSAFPEFQIDYFGMKIWRTSVKHRRNKRVSCESLGTAQENILWDRSFQVPILYPASFH